MNLDAKARAARLATCRELAAAGGGKCLSRTWAGSEAKIRFRCAEGHVFESRIYPILHGGWCQACARLFHLPADERRRMLEELRTLAEGHGGACLSDAYVNEKTSMRWRCVAGHEWDAKAAHVRRGTWCPRCIGRGATIDDMQALAREAGGTCLSTTYVDSQTHLRWRCASGHTWDAAPSNIRRGGWCPYCSGRRSINLAGLRKLARGRGGACLADHYENVATKVEWRCAAGHTWSAPAGRILRGSWCPKCAGHQKGDLDQMRKLARKRRGQCISTEYVNSSTKLRWRCAEGHEWEAVPHQVTRGAWCPECNQGGAGRPKSRITLTEVQAAAAARGGRCRSRVYVNSTTKLEFECALGHQWSTTPSSLLRRGSWCPECAGVVKGTIEAMHALAAERGGRCLSTDYVDNRTHLEWECAGGHRWSAMPFQVRQGTWCGKCQGKARLDLETMQWLAGERGGRCLSTTYVNVNSPLEWECSAGHRWTARAANVRAGAWCVRCAGRAPYDLARMQEIAASRGGKCLATVFEGAKVPLRWRCEHGHEWTSLPRTVVAGCWCPECAHEASIGPRKQVGAGVRPRRSSGRGRAID